jgi:hypothetical protein
MEWISVKDRLPEEDQYVLVADFQFDLDVRFAQEYYFIGKYLKGRWIANTSEAFVSVDAGWNGGVISSDVNQDDVTHWMLLPKPPKK